MSILPPQGVRLSADKRRALEMLAAAGLHGCTGSALSARGVNIDMLAALVHDGFATARREIVRVGKRKITIARVWIAEAGQKALES